jgi:nucleoside-diphosphate-sugar epimerase
LSIDDITPLGSKTYLVTGVRSGLGKYLYERLPGPLGVDRNNKEKMLAKAAQSDGLIILHAAFNSKRDLDDYSSYAEDNLFLTEELLSIPHDKFVYFSSVDVYGPFNPYSFMKRCAEDLVRKRSKDALILRLPAILGPTIRKNSLVKLLEGDELTLAGESVFNYVLQSDILEAIRDTDTTDKAGIYNFVSSDNVSLAQLASYYRRGTKFGDYKYQTSLENSRGIPNLYPHRDRTSLDVVRLFLKEYYE